MKKLAIILSVLLLLTACDSQSSSNPTHETSLDFTPLIQMTKYEMEQIEELKEYDFEYYTYGEIKEGEPVEDWPFDMDKHVLDDGDVIGYSFDFYKYDTEAKEYTNISSEDFATFLGWVFNLSESFDAELIDEDDYGYDAKITVSTLENDYNVYYSAERLGADDYKVNDCTIMMTF